MTARVPPFLRMASLVNTIVMMLMVLMLMVLIVMVMMLIVDMKVVEMMLIVSMVDNLFNFRLLQG